MPGTWSISTTLRNPERIAGFLKVLARFEGQMFDEHVQAQYFTELIRAKEYMPNGLSDHYKLQYEDPEPFTNRQLEEILSQVRYENKSFHNDQKQAYAFRGRTAVSNITKMGLAIAKESMGAVQITELGKRLIAGQIDLVDVFFRYFLKWQLPNPTERGYRDFNIVPFIAVMHVIDKVNRGWSQLGYQPIGVSKEEFSLFLTTLTDYRDIEDRARQIVEFRQAKKSLGKTEAQRYVDRRFAETAVEVFRLDPTDQKNVTKKVNNLFDYGDSAIRYFRQTQLLYYRGNGRYVDLAPTRKVEIDTILQHFDGSAADFRDADEYLHYMSDIHQPQLPWENADDLKLVYDHLLDRAISLQSEISHQYGGRTLHQYSFARKSLNTVSEYRREISSLREKIKTLNNDLFILRERSLQNLDTYMKKLLELANRKRSVSGQDPLNLEYYVTLSLMALDDAREISPNYSVGDDNLPLFTAPGNKPDIECRYSSFHMICEVTLLRGRDQWFHEGQPVMRHLRDVEEREENRNADIYCLFLAPSIHRDTLNTFWMSVKWGYEGKVQKIVPLTIEQFVRVLKKVKEWNERGVRMTHQHFKELLSKIFYSHEAAGLDSTAWLEQVDSIIDEWGSSVPV